MAFGLLLNLSSERVVAMDNTREKLIDILSKAHESYYSKFDPSKTYMDVMADHLIANGVVISNLETTTKWIPVTERLPEPWKWILGYCEAGYIEMLRYDDFMDEWGSVNINRAYKKDYVTHWMPLPEPLKGE